MFFDDKPAEEFLFLSEIMFFSAGFLFSRLILEVS